MNTNRNFSAGSDGSILLIVLVIAVIVGAIVFALLQLANAGLLAQRVEKDSAQALQNAFSGLEIVRNAIDISAYHYYGGEEHNDFLWAADSTADGNPGAQIDLNGVSTVVVNYLGSSWYELFSIAPIGNITVGDVEITDEITIYSIPVGEITRVVKLRVEETYIGFGTVNFGSNEITVEDRETIIGALHSNGKIVFEDDITGVGAQLHDLVTSTNYFTYNKNAQPVELGGETYFHGGYVENLNRKLSSPYFPIDEPKADTGAWGPDGTIHTVFDDSEPPKVLAKFGSGPGGFSILGDVDVYIEFINSEVKIIIKDKSGQTLYPTEGDTEIFPVPQGPGGEVGVIHVGRMPGGGPSGNIAGIKGELNGRVAVCCESDISITADLVYEDDSKEKAILFDFTYPEVTYPEGIEYLLNENYTGNSLLILLAKNDILYTGTDDDDANLEVNAAMVAGLSGSPGVGDIKYSGTEIKGHLRTYGLRWCRGKIERCYGLAPNHKGYTESGVHAFNEEEARYLKEKAEYLPRWWPGILVPSYAGLEIVPQDKIEIGP